MKYHIITFGCQMNISDSERIASILEERNYKPADLESADLIVVNMCSVRQSAVDRVMGLEKKFKDLKAKTLLTGCVIGKDRKKMSEIFDYIVDINKLPAFFKKKQIDYLKTEPKYSNKFSAIVPIMTGCNNLCTYCVVPHVRGKEISRKAKEIVCEVKSLINRGFKEIWLMGQNVNSYKDDSIDFPELLKMVNNIPGNFWIRFTSSHPKDFSPVLIDVMASYQKVTPYLNLPVQAGDDTILNKMNRPYTIKQYESIIKKVRDKIPNITLSTDIIVGFPGETKKQFLNSKKLFEKIKYDMAYIAQYSIRPGTAASKMKDSVPRLEKVKRKIELNNILRKTSLEKNKSYLNKIVEVLINEKGKDNYWIGKTREYKTIQISSGKNLLGIFIKAKVIQSLPWGLKGKLI